MQNTAQRPAPIPALLARPNQTAMVTRGVARLFVNLRLAPLAEFTLVNGRRVDIAGLDARGRLVFAEVKSCRADFEGDAKWPEYLAFCDEFYFAVDPLFPIDLIPAEAGLIFADAFGGMVERPAQTRPLGAARRKAVTLRFARQAARGALARDF